MTIPADLKYTESHEWVRKEADGSVTVGITHHAQEALGDIVYVEVPDVGAEFESGKECAVIESVKAASDIYAPLSGTITANNQDVVSKPDLINGDAYSAWLFKMQLSDPSQLDGLLDAAGYAAAIGQ